MSETKIFAKAQAIGEGDTTKLMLFCKQRSLHCAVLKDQIRSCPQKFSSEAFVFQRNDLQASL